MARPPERRRALLFAVVCALLVGSAFLFAASRPASQPEPTASAAPVMPPLVARAAARAERLANELRRSARRFLAAFLRYEVGQEGARLTAALRATATPSFAKRLLARPPRVPVAGRLPPPARLGRLQVGFLSGAATRALVSATAWRGPRPEELSFVFARRRSRWLASGPGQ